MRHRGVPVVDLPTAFLHDGRPQRTLDAAAPAPVRQPARPPRRRSGGDAARPARPPEHRLEGGRRPPLRPRDRRRHRRAPAGRRGRPTGTATASCSPLPTTITASPSASVSTPGTGCTTPRRWRPSSSTRRSATSSPSAPTPTASPCSTTSRGATRSTPTTLGELVAAVAGCCRAAIAHGAPFVSGKDSLNNTYVGEDGARHAVPPTLVITAIAHVPDVERVRDRRAAIARERAPARRPHRRALRRQPPRPAAWRPPAAVTHGRSDPATRPGRAGALPTPARGDPRRPGGELPRRERGRPRRDRWPSSASRRGSGPASTAPATRTSPPACSPRAAAASSSRSRPTTSTPSPSWSVTPPCSARSPPTPCCGSPAPSPSTSPPSRGRSIHERASLRASEPSSTVFPSLVHPLCLGRVASTDGAPVSERVFERANHQARSSRHWCTRSAWDASHRLTVHQ